MAMLDGLFTGDVLFSSSSSSSSDSFMPKPPEKLAYLFNGERRIWNKKKKNK